MQEPIFLKGTTPEALTQLINEGIKKKPSKVVETAKHHEKGKNFKTILEIVLLIIKIGQKIDPKMISDFILKVNIFFENHHLF